MPEGGDQGLFRLSTGVQVPGVIVRDNGDGTADVMLFDGRQTIVHGVVHANATAWSPKAATGGGSANSAVIDVDFGAAFGNIASVVVTGLSWITANTRLSVACKPAAGAESECALLQFSAVVSAIVPGAGCTVTVVSPVRARGTYSFTLAGV